MKYPKTAPVKVIIIGAGGTGGYVIPHLYRISFAAAVSYTHLTLPTTPYV